MLIARKRRLYFIVILLLGVSAAVGFSLYALRQNINLYLTPSQVVTNKKLPADFRLGGMVLLHSVHKQPNSMAIRFVVTDYKQQLKVRYSGLLPSLFREGQGIVAQGHLNAQGVFEANMILAKHDASYHPPGIGQMPRQGSLLVATK